ncbi:hypothetical protein [Paenibacillus sp. S150]|uniref:hypothetical protein n=1 Tax=Paenibacillus sp. S150 TaxID=2749826 RepID=UPI001C5A13D6|nr:hypothetical protein [Paenibacillus sp. S150]
MDEHEVIKFMGRFPDRINPDPMLSKSWKCSMCGTEYKFAEPVDIPGPCSCGSIAFTKTD